MAHESKSNKTPLYLIGELIGVPNTVMDSALHELKDRIDKDPKYKDVKNWLESLPCLLYTSPRIPNPMRF